MEQALDIEGWKKGFRIPVANDENQRLQEELEKLILRKRDARTAFENVDEKCNSLKGHLKLVKQQNDENQRLLTIFQQQIDVEESKYHTVTAERQSTIGETKRLTKETDEVTRRQETKKNDLSRTLEKIEKIKAELDWDTEALNTWEESLKIKSDDNELLMKFAKEDRRKISELEIQRKNLQADQIARQNAINKVAADVINSENILQRTGKHLKELRIERQAMIRKWQEAARNLYRQDDNIAKANLEAESVARVTADALEKLEEQNMFYEEQKNNNREIEMEVAEMNTRGSKMRRELDELVQYVISLTNDLSTYRQMLISTANALDSERSRGRMLIKDILNKERKIIYMRNHVQNLRKKLKEITNSSMSAAERANELEKMIEYEQRQANVLAQDVGRIQAKYYRTQQGLVQSQDELKRKEIELSGMQSRIVALKKESQATNNNVVQHKEAVYEIDFKMNHLEAKLAKLEGETNVYDESGVIIQQKYEELVKKFDEVSETRNLLQKQATALQDEMRRLTCAITADDAQTGLLKEKLQEQITYYEVGKKQLVTAGNNSRKKRVDENVLRLRVDQLEKSINREDYLICDIKKYMLQLDTVMRERLIELGTNKEIVNLKRRNVNEEKSRLKRDLSTRLIKVDQLQKKYYMALMCLGKDDSGQPLSVTHFKIKKAQEKYMLQQEGDQLDNKVKKAEKEIIAMENTLKVVNSANVAFRNSVSAIDTEGEELQEQRELENDIFNFNTVLHKNKRRLGKQMKLIESLKIKTNEVITEKKELEEVYNTWETSYVALQNMIAENERKLRKCDRHLEAVIQNLDMAKIDKYNKNLLIRHLQDANKRSLRKLSDLCVQFQEVSSKVHCYLSSYNLEVCSTDTNKLLSISDFESQQSDSTRSYPSLNSKSSTIESLKAHSVTNVMLTFDGNLCPKVCKCPQKRNLRRTQKKF
ncbi:coiled-coil domain-containing protein 39 [Agrilus planipennis]|uniref:Coiled-coil domain-containing protein 39 n=1 Tax=Agrilus planipennis TaxID=224129 RepID=A0A1W4XT53_AGRPL|nr:coiled-coil domain-containing protein 39 [Agrilus planipennis]